MEHRWISLIEPARNRTAQVSEGQSAWLHHVLDVVIYDPASQDLFPEDWRDAT